jgi:exopolyphosphatase/guanosine-5'-triphosphate,3'-diphosphate pyrophosphatase
MRRYHVAAKQAKRVADLSAALAQQFLGEQFDESTKRYLQWAANLHEIGISVAHSGYHKHSSYILANADMPGFSKKEQTLLSFLTLAHRGRLEKLRAQLREPKDQALVMSLRLATLFCRNRSGVQLPKMQGHFSGTKFHLSLESGWLTQNPLSETALQEEAAQWKELDISVQVGEA